MQDKKEFLGTEPVKKLLVKLAIPTIIAQLINMLYNIVDRIYIGNIPVEGTAALTGVGVCLPIIMIVSAFATFVAAGSAPKASICLGKKDPETAEKIVGGSFTLQIIISIILTTILLIWNRDFLLAFGASEDTIDYATKYMNIYAIGTIFVQMTLGMNAFITAQGFTKTSMIAVLLGAVTNIILDPIFIFGFKMGVEGAALATVISQALSTIWVIVFLLSKKSIIKLKPKYFFVSPKIILPCIALGTSTFVMQASESVIIVCFNSSLQKYGGDIAVGAMTILSSVMQFAMLPLQGIGQGAQPITSYNYGARKPERVKQTYKLLLIASLTYSVLLWAFVMILPKAFARMFSPDPELVNYTAKVLRIYCAVMAIFGIQMACQMTFVAIGKALSSIIVAVVRKFVLLLPLIYIMPAIFTKDQTIAVFTAEPVADFLAVTFTAILFSIQFKKAIQKISVPETGEVKAA